MRTLLSSPHFWGILTLLIAAAVIVGSVWILKYSYSLILPEDYGKLKNKFGTPLKSIDIMIKRVPLPEILCFLGIHYIHLNAPDTGKVDIYGDKIVFSAQNYALVINTKDPDFAKKVYIEQPYVTISNFEGELPENGSPIGLEIILTDELNQLIMNIMESNQNV